MVKRIIFGQFMLVALAGCSKGSSVYKMDQQGTGRSSMPYIPQYFNSSSCWNNVAAGSSSSQATSTNNSAQFGSHATLNNANINMAAMSNSQAAYVSKGAQSNPFSQNANYPQYCNSNSYWNNVAAGSSSSQAISTNNSAQFGNDAQLNNVHINMGAMNNSHAAYVDKGAQSNPFSQNANYPQYFNSSSDWNNVTAGSSSRQVTSNNSIVQFGNEARLNNVNINTGSISSSTAFVKNTSQTSLMAQDCNINYNFNTKSKSIFGKALTCGIVQKNSPEGYNRWWIEEIKQKIEEHERLAKKSGAQAGLYHIQHVEKLEKKIDRIGEWIEQHPGHPKIENMHNAMADKQSKLDKKAKLANDKLNSREYHQDKIKSLHKRALAHIIRNGKNPNEELGRYANCQDILDRIHD